MCIEKEIKDKKFLEKFEKELQEHWEATKEEIIRTHTTKILEKEV